MEASNTSPEAQIDDAQASLNRYPLILSLQQRCMNAQDSAELSFVIANETWQVIQYRQAFVFTYDGLGRPSLKVVSGLATLQGETPFTLWLGRVCRAASADFSGTEPQRLDAGMLEHSLRENWAEWWPPHAVFVPMHGRQGQRNGFTVFVRETAWQDADLQILGLLATTWGYCQQSLLGQRPTLAEVRERLWNHRHRKKAMLIIACCLFFPVRLSALAPAEVIPLQAETVAAPMDGVVKTFHAPPNSDVKAGQLLYSLDDTTLRNRRDVALQALGVARADALAAQQKAFDNVQSKAELATLLGKVREKEAELSYVDEALTRIDVKAPLDGVFVYGDPNDWIGKPVVTGERIAQLARADDLGVLMWLPVGDAINLETGADMRVFLQVAPLSALSAQLVQTSYQASLSPEGVAAYRIRGKLETGSVARIGLRGVAKVYGSWRPLAYWILRRPLGTLRQWMGV